MCWRGRVFCASRYGARSLISTFCALPISVFSSLILCRRMCMMRHWSSRDHLDVDGGAIRCHVVHWCWFSQAQWCCILRSERAVDKEYLPDSYVDELWRCLYILTSFIYAASLLCSRMSFTNVSGMSRLHKLAYIPWVVPKLIPKASLCPM